jgi:hypothetical protein
VLEKKGNEAIGLLYEALEIERRIVRDEEEVFDPNATSSTEYTLLMKMYELTESLGYGQYSVFLLKSALAVCPSLWKEKIVNLL